MTNHQSAPAPQPSRGVRVVLFNAEQSAWTTLRSTLLTMEGVKIVAEIDEPVLLREAVERISADLVLVHLDPDPEPVLTIVGEVVRAHPELPVIAMSDSTDGQLILLAMRGGVKEFLPEPLQTAELSAAIEKVVHAKADQHVSGKLITVMGSAGGVGATAVATNLAVEVAAIVGKDSPGKGVTLVDLDYRFGQVGTMLDLDPTFTIADLCESHEQLENQIVERTLVEHASGVWALCRPLQIAQADNITAAHCVGVLSALMNMHSYVVVDGPNRFDAGAKAVFDLADVNLLLLQLLVPCVRSARRMLDGMRDAGYNMDRTRVVCNRLGQESSSLSVEDVEATLNVPIYATIPDDWAAMSNSINMGDPLLSSAAHSKVRAAIATLAERLHKPRSPSDDKDEVKKGRKRFARLVNQLID